MQIHSATLSRRSSPSNCSEVSMYARKGNFTHGHDNRRDFPAPIFMKLADAQQNYVRIHYTDFLR